MKLVNNRHYEESSFIPILCSYTNSSSGPESQVPKGLCPQEYRNLCKWSLQNSTLIREVRDIVQRIIPVEHTIMGRAKQFIREVEVDNIITTLVVRKHMFQNGIK